VVYFTFRPKSGLAHNVIRHNKRIQFRTKKIHQTK